MLYVPRLRRREVKISSTMLWQRLMQDREANMPWQKLRCNLLLLQLLILAALVLALGRPFVPVPSVVAGKPWGRRPRKGRRGPRSSRSLSRR